MPSVSILSAAAPYFKTKCYEAGKDATTFSLISLLWHSAWHFCDTSCGNIGFLSKGQMHVGTRVSSTNLCEVINCWHHLFLTQTHFEEEEWIFLLRCMSWKVPWYSAKRIFWNIPWASMGTIKRKMHTNIWGSSVRYCNSHK
jgi:hypothetical protein